MSQEIAVVKPYYLKEEAYRMGFNEFSGINVDDTKDFDIAPFTDSARWTNIILPELRCMAGYQDNGRGTYQHRRQVAAIKDGCEEDEPAEAELVDSRYVFEDLVDAWQEGAYDAVEES